MNQSQQKGKEKGPVSLLPGSSKKEQSVTSDWEIIQEPIKGVVCKQVRPVPKARMHGTGHVIELFRSDWPGFDHETIQQVFAMQLNNTGDMEFWHVHMNTWDCFATVVGSAKIVLYDARVDSPTFDRVNVYMSTVGCYQTVLVPPGVYHGVMNIGDGPLVLINAVNFAYRYENPDHWSLEYEPPFTHKFIPYDLINHRLIREHDPSDERKQEVIDFTKESLKD